MKTLIAMVVLTCFACGQAAKTKPQPTGITDAATWTPELKAAKITLAHLVLNDVDDSEFEFCVNRLPEFPPQNPVNIKKCNMVIDHLERWERKHPTPSW